MMGRVSYSTVPLCAWNRAFMCASPTVNEANAACSAKGIGWYVLPPGPAAKNLTEPLGTSFAWLGL